MNTFEGQYALLDTTKHFWVPSNYGGSKHIGKHLDFCKVCNETTRFYSCGSATKSSIALVCMQCDTKFSRTSDSTLTIVPPKACGMCGYWTMGDHNPLCEKRVICECGRHEARTKGKCCFCHGGRGFLNTKAFFFILLDMHDVRRTPSPTLAYEHIRAIELPNQHKVFAVLQRAYNYGRLQRSRLKPPLCVIGGVAEVAVAHVADSNGYCTPLRVTREYASSTRKEALELFFNELREAPSVLVCADLLQGSPLGRRVPDYEHEATLEIDVSVADAHELLVCKSFHYARSAFYSSICTTSDGWYHLCVLTARMQTTDVEATLVALHVQKKLIRCRTEEHCRIVKAQFEAFFGHHA